MLKVAAALFVFLGGFAIMVLEIIGARYLAKDFGGSFYVWISQIGVILIALALGYAVGGALADRFHRAAFLPALLRAGNAFPLHDPSFHAAPRTCWNDQRPDLRRKHRRQHRGRFRL